jgi:hypothetical protein
LQAFLPPFLVVAWLMKYIKNVKNKDGLPGIVYWRLSESTSKPKYYRTLRTFWELLCERKVQKAMQNETGKSSPE